MQDVVLEFNVYRYTPNPDKVINSYGRILIKLCEDNHMYLINVLLYQDRQSDTDFTFFVADLSHKMTGAPLTAFIV